MNRNEININMEVKVINSQLYELYGKGIVRSVCATTCTVEFKDVKDQKPYIGIYKLEDIIRPDAC